MQLIFLILALWFWPLMVMADDLGCFESGTTVSGAFTQFTGTATSVTAGVTDKDDSIASPYVSPTMTDRGSNVWTAADFTAGSTVGLHKIRMTGTVSGSTEVGIDTFIVASQCPLGSLTSADIDDCVAELGCLKSFTTHATSSTTTVVYCAAGQCTEAADAFVNLKRPLFLSCASPGYEFKRLISDFVQGVDPDYFTLEGSNPLPSEPDATTCRITQ